ncbi:MAG: DUF1987 domain-containing protein [Tenuifilaceae bacterium]
MEKYQIEASEDSPSISFDGEKGLLEIIGKSLPEDAVVYYSPLEKLVQEYVQSPQKTTTINFNLEYLNSSSAKKILEIITMLEGLPAQGYQVNINWFYKAEDEDMHEEGEEFRRMTDLNVSLEKLH